MNIYIDENGTAQINEVWNAYLYKGTEGYRTFTNLGNVSIGNFLVIDEKNIHYKILIIGTLIYHSMKKETKKG